MTFMLKKLNLALISMKFDGNKTAYLVNMKQGVKSELTQDQKDVFQLFKNSLHFFLGRILQGLCNNMFAATYFQLSSVS